MPLFHRPRETPVPVAPQARLGALEAALRVGEIAAGDASPAEATAAIVRVAIDLLGAEQGSLMLLAEDERTLVLVAAEGEPIPAAIGASLQVGESVAGRVAASGRPLRLEAVDRDEFVNFIPKSRPISSSVVVPLRAAGRAIGALSLALSHPAMQFSDENLRVAQLFADQAAGVIHRTRLHERAERRSADLLALIESSRELVGALDADDLLQRILDGGTRLASATVGFTCLFDPEGGRIVRGTFRGVDKQTIARVAASPDARRAAGSDDVVVFEWEGLGRLVAVGIGGAHGRSGVLVASAESAAARDRIDLLRAFAGQCASALSAADLHMKVLRKESELNAIIDGVPSPIVMADAATRVVAMNSAAEHLFGTSAAFVAGAAAEDALNNPALVALLAARGDVTGEVVAGSPPRTYKVRARDLRAPGALPGRVAILDDVTAEREIVQMQRNFVSMIGHELRTPLTIIKGFARTALRKRDELPAVVRDSFVTIDARAGQLERLIEDLLYVSGIEAREAKVRHERVALGPLIDAVVAQLAPSHAGRTVDVEMPEGLDWVVDEAKLAVVLRHLVDNALKYSEAPDPVVVRARVDPAASELRIDVVDRGTGIVSSELGEIFERFHQVDNSLTRHHGGTGVGLYLCSRLVEAHGGRIWVDSVWGKGSTFSVALPDASEKEAASRRRLETA